MQAKLSVKQVVEPIEQLAPQERVELITVLPAVLKVAPGDCGWLGVSKSAHSCWDNEDYAIYGN